MRFAALTASYLLAWLLLMFVPLFAAAQGSAQPEAATGRQASADVFARRHLAVTANPHVEVLVIRSGRPAGFCGGADPAIDLTHDLAPDAYTLAGQRVLNRLVNWFIQLAFGIRFNDTTNAFKAYRRSVIEGCRPFLSPHFNLTVEIPLKAIVRGYSYEVVPIGWRQRRHGISSLHLREMGSRYLYIVLNVWLERLLTRGDYRRPPAPSPQAEKTASHRSE